MIANASTISAINNHMRPSLFVSRARSTLTAYHLRYFRPYLVTAILLALTVLLQACQTPVPATKPNADDVATKPSVATSMPAASAQSAIATSTPPPNASWRAVELMQMPGWSSDRPLDAWPALQRSCTRLGQRSPWQAFCATTSPTPTSDSAARALLEKHLVAYAQTDETGKELGIATAYFEPIYAGSLQRGGVYQWPLYAAPEPLLTVPREQLTPSNGAVHPKLVGNELAWLDNPIDPFLAQVQGSVRIRLPDGSIKRLGFAAKNGQPYQSIANTLIRQGVFSAAQASMERIKAWSVGKDRATVQTVLNSNPSFVFFKWLDLPLDVGPVGAYNLPLTAMRSVAVDTAFTPLGVPIWLDTTTADGVLNQLMLAQDVGSAIKGAARVDIYTGTGEAAGRLASQQKNPSKVWVLWPR